jgi:hypothetical protein
MPWLTPVVFKQAAGEPLTRLPRFDDGPRHIRFRHLVHAYRDLATPANTDVQSITFDTIAKARHFAQPDYPVTCVAVTYPDDADLIPADVVVAPFLRRVVTDVVRFAVPRPLPLLFDVLRNGMAAPVEEHRDPSRVEFVVLTNSDIHLQPPFYRVVAELIRRGYDAITINRRTIDAGLSERAFTPLFMAEPGHEHAGFDCFVFPSEMFERFASNNACCGAGGVMRSLLFNLAAHAGRFLMLTQAHLTFHLGDDLHWKDQTFADYIEFNWAEVRSLAASLAKDPDKAKRLIEFIEAHESKKIRGEMRAILSTERGAGSESRAMPEESDIP